MPILWWVNSWKSIKFILRELTSLVVAGYAIIFLLWIRAIRLGPESFDQFTTMFKHPAFIALHVFAMIALVFHSITWFNLAPQAMVIKVGDKKIPGIIIALSNYAGWAIISGALFWFILGS